ncbi:hypothetical protein CUJ84_pRLN3000028 (plasmid) [Rhizobium leguminosarum]|uniref:Helix-turn-helix domain-containing protein n=1 Tax=Rhizobium leguminosarum TaxID=384 RepID=A0A2K9ZG47_RHILE|nr:hypothetical protein CUJ84_pRLN3000028 [Rhizobium leguminosarum]
MKARYWPWICVRPRLAVAACGSSEGLILGFICVSTLKEVSMNIKFHIELSQSERDQLAALLSGGCHRSRKIKRAQILVAANEGFSDEVIAATLNVSGSTIYRTKRRFVEANLEGALSEEPRPGVERKLSSKEEALLVATACSKPPPEPAGPWSFWQMRWSGSPIMTSCPRRPCVAGWLRTISSLGAKTCGASQRSMGNTSRAWRMFSTSTQKRLIHKGPWSASTRARPNSSAKRASPLRPSLASLNATIASIAETARSICLSSWTPTGPGAG